MFNLLLIEILQSERLSLRVMEELFSSQKFQSFAGLNQRGHLLKRIFLVSHLIVLYKSKTTPNFIANCDILKSAIGFFSPKIFSYSLLPLFDMKLFKPNI